MELIDLSFEKTTKLYQKYFGLGYLNSNLGDKLACIALTCYLTNELKKKGKIKNCYELLLKVGSDFKDLEKNTFLKSLGAMCDDFMYGCDSFPDFGITPKEMPKTLKRLLSTYVPF